MRVNDLIRQARERLLKKMDTPVLEIVEREKREFKKGMVCLVAGATLMATTIIVSKFYTPHGLEVQLLYILLMIPSFLLFLKGMNASDSTNMSKWMELAKDMDDQDWFYVSENDDSHRILSTLLKEASKKGRLSKYILEEIKKERVELISTIGKARILNDESLSEKSNIEEKPLNDFLILK